MNFLFLTVASILVFEKLFSLGLHWCFGPLILYDNLITNSVSSSRSILFWSLIKWIQHQWLRNIKKLLYPILYSLAVATELLSLLNSLQQKECHLHHHLSKKPKTGTHPRHFSFLFLLHQLSHLFPHIYFYNVFQNSALTSIFFLSHGLL